MALASSMTSVSSLLDNASIVSMPDDRKLQNLDERAFVRMKPVVPDRAFTSPVILLLDRAQDFRYLYADHTVIALRMSRNPNLPARPNFVPVEASAGPSRSAPRRQPAHPRPPPAVPSHFAPQAFAPQPYGLPAPNLSGGCQPAGGYPWGTYNSYGYGQAYVPQFYGQALFSSAQPYANPQGYAYSQTYLADAHAQPSAAQHHTEAPAAKRFRPCPPSTAAVTGTGGTWRNCSVSGCKFVGPEQDVAIHEGDRHLLFPSGKPVERSEEEERAAKRKG